MSVTWKWQALLLCFSFQIGASVTSPVSDMLSEGSVAHSVVADSLQRHGLQPTRLLCPWDSPGKKTGVGCHFSPPENLPSPGIEPASLVPPVESSRFFTTSLPGKPRSDITVGKQRLTYVQFNMYRGLVKDIGKMDQNVIISLEKTCFTVTKYSAS